MDANSPKPGAAGAGRERRKLTAIMFTDMVGYTALSQQSESLALELLEEHRRLLRSAFPRHDGVEIKTIGDAFLVEFDSALDAAQCAIDIQRLLAKRNVSESPERQIQVRIGIHVGDVVHREGDVLGDGVNIASRIEPLAEPGGICISVDVAHQIQHSLGEVILKIGPTDLRNVQVPVEICRIVLPWQARGETAFLRQGLEWHPPAWRKMGMFAAAVALVALGAIVCWRTLLAPFLNVPGSVSKSAVTNAAGAAQAPAAKSVAVLPFVNLSPDESDEYLSDGLTEELIHLLTRVPGLRVPARTSSFAFKGKNEDIRRIGQLLTVRTVLEGSVRKSGNRVRVTAQLINVEDGFHLWSEVYERDVGDLLAMQEEIARQIVERLRLELSGATRQQLAKRSTRNPEAHELYLKGLYWAGRRTKANLEKGLTLIKEALKKDPTFAAAYAALAGGCCQLVEYAGNPPPETLAAAQSSAGRALELDPAMPEAQAAMGLVNTFLWDWPAAEAALKKAVELNPNYVTGHHWYSLYLRTQGRFDEAITQIQQALELDPLSPIVYVNLGDCLYYSGQYDRAIQELRKGLELSPDFMILHQRLGEVFIAKGMFSEAEAQFQKVRVLAGDSPYGLGDWGALLARTGRPAEARRVLADLQDFDRRRYAVHVDMAKVHLALGDNERALTLLEQAHHNLEMLNMVKVDPAWQELRREPRFRKLLGQMNLAP